ncbi:MAG TPA: Na+/H+ antiporter subunit E [Acidimicrobiales bacterium]|nr:Na+/H+ antiporter subunit E [Acidimicrobiales bacterium]
MTKAFHLLWLVLIWLALWSEVSWANVASGIAVSGVIAAAYGLWHRGAMVVRPWRILKLLVIFLIRLTESTFVVARTVVTPRVRIQSGIVAVPLSDDYPDALVTLIADLNSLTPGTITLDVRRHPTILYMHVLHIKSIDSVLAASRQLEEVAVEAFGDERALAALHEDRSDVVVTEA